MAHVWHTFLSFSSESTQNPGSDMRGLKQLNYLIKDNCLKFNLGKIQVIAVRRKKVFEPWLQFFLKAYALCCSATSLSSCVVASEHPDGIGLKPRSGGNVSLCGLRPEPGVLCATKHRVTEKNVKFWRVATNYTNHRVPQKKY